MLDRPGKECEHLLPLAGSPHFSGRRWFALFLVLAHVARGELEAAAAGGNWDEAEDHFRSALAFVDQIGDRIGKPSVQKWYAWMLLRRDAPGVRDQARVLLDVAIMG